MVFGQKIETLMSGPAAYIPILSEHSERYLDGVGNSNTCHCAKISRLGSTTDPSLVTMPFLPETFLVGKAWSRGYTDPRYNAKLSHVFVFIGNNTIKGVWPWV